MYGYDQNAYAGQQQPPYTGHQQPPPAGYGGHHGQHHHQQSGYAEPSQHVRPQAQQGAPPGGGAPPAAPSLADALRAYTSGALSTEEFQDVFWGAKVYCPRGETPGFLAVQTTQEPVIPLFTSLRELRSYAGKESRYFTVTGGEVLDLLPAGYGFALDMEGEHRIVVDARSVEEMTEYAMRRVYG